MIINKMEKLKNLGYRIKRFFMDEGGIVEKVEVADYKDSFGKLERVTFRNPLGELITKYSYTNYKTYMQGDKFP